MTRCNSKTFIHMSVFSKACFSPDGDHPFLPLADTNICLIPNKGDVISHIIVP